MFNSDGSSPSEVTEQLFNLGFKAAKGNYDFVYDWGKKDKNVEDLIWFADKVHATLKDTKVFFSIETI